jgi:DNA polymerase elongation subunit (family B)
LTYLLFSLSEDTNIKKKAFFHVPGTTKDGFMMNFWKGMNPLVTTTLPTTISTVVKQGQRQDDESNDNPVIENIGNVVVRRRIVPITTTTAHQQQYQPLPNEKEDLHHYHHDYSVDSSIISHENEMQTLLTRQLSASSINSYDDINDNELNDKVLTTDGETTVLSLPHKIANKKSTMQQYEGNGTRWNIGDLIRNHFNITMLSSIFNLVNNVAGAGILTLPSGQAAGTGYIPAIFIAVTLGCTSAHTFILIGKACQLTQEYNFKVK